MDLQWRIHHQVPVSHNNVNGLSSGTISIYSNVHESSVTSASEPFFVSSTVSESSDIFDHCTNKITQNNNETRNAITRTFYLINRLKHNANICYTHTSLEDDADITEDTSCNIYFKTGAVIMNS